MQHKYTVIEEGTNLPEFFSLPIPNAQNILWEGKYYGVRYYGETQKELPGLEGAEVHQRDYLFTQFPVREGKQNFSVVELTFPSEAILQTFVLKKACPSPNSTLSLRFVDKFGVFPKDTTFESPEGEVIVTVLGNFDYKVGNKMPVFGKKLQGKLPQDKQAATPEFYAEMLGGAGRNWEDTKSLLRDKFPEIQSFVPLKILWNKASSPYWHERTADGKMRSSRATSLAGMFLKQADREYMSVLGVMYERQKGVVVWKTVSEALFRKRLIEFLLLGNYEQANLIEQTVRVIKTLVHVDSWLVNASKYALGREDGQLEILKPNSENEETSVIAQEGDGHTIVRVKESDLREHITQKLGYNPEEGDLTGWDKYMEEMLQGEDDPEGEGKAKAFWIEYYIAATLVRTQGAPDERFVMCHGKQGCGKTAFSAIVNGLLGSYYQTVANDSFTSIRAEQKNSEWKVPLSKACIVVQDDSDTVGGWNEATFKTAVSGKIPLIGRGLYKSSEPINCRFGALLNANDLPRSVPEPIAARLSLLEFPNTYRRTSEVIEHIHEKMLKAYGPQLLHRLLGYARDFVANDQKLPEETFTMVAAKQEYIEESDLVKTWAEECLEWGEGYTSTIPILLELHLTWRSQKRIAKQISQREFRKALIQLAKVLGEELIEPDDNKKAGLHQIQRETLTIKGGYYRGPVKKVFKGVRADMSMLDLNKLPTGLLYNGTSSGPKPVKPKTGEA